MKIVMMTNTYLPLVGGVAASVEAFSAAFRQAGHEVLIVAPTFDNLPPREHGVVRVPAIQHFNGSDFSVRLPIFGLLGSALQGFDPDIVHAHHPFLLGDTALRVASRFNTPIVFTHHTMYEQYTHYVPGDSPAMKRFAVRLATEYANLCDHVIAPSESIARILQQRGVTTPVTAIPTGIDIDRFSGGDGERARKRYRLEAGRFVVGHVGRLAPEKNLGFLAEAVARFVAANDDAVFLVVGGGPAEGELQSAFDRHGVAERLCLTGPLVGQELIDAYTAMDVFAFASHSETQGMVLAEAMATGTPVVALDAPGAREVVRDGENGRLLAGEDTSQFVAGLREIASATGSRRRMLAQAARETAGEFAMPRCAKRVLDIYEQLSSEKGIARSYDENSAWATLLRRINEEWLIAAKMGAAAGQALFGSSTSRRMPRTP